MFSFARDPEPSPSLIDLDLDKIPCFFGFGLLRLDGSVCRSESFDKADGARWSKRTTSELVSTKISKTGSFGQIEALTIGIGSAHGAAEIRCGCATPSVGIQGWGRLLLVKLP